MLAYSSKILLGVIMSVIIATSGYAVSGVELREEADRVREEGRSLAAIDLYNQAIVQYQASKDYSDMLAALTGRLLSWKHLFYKTEDKIYAIFVKKEAEMMLEVAKTYNLMDRLYLIHFLNGTSAILLKDYNLAEKEFDQAVQLYPTENPEKGDWIGHLGDAMYRNGKKEEGKKVILNGVEIIKDRSAQIDSFLFNVWVSGAYLRLAKLLKTDDPVESQLFFKQAKEIIDSDDRLVIRKQQLEAFMSDLGNY
jgi:hypothetical protein